MIIFACGANDPPTRKRAVFVSDRQIVTPSLTVKVPMMSRTAPCAYELCICLSTIHHLVGVMMNLGEKFNRGIRKSRLTTRPVAIASKPGSLDPARRTKRRADSKIAPSVRLRSASPTAGKPDVEAVSSMGLFLHREDGMSQ